MNQVHLIIGKKHRSNHASMSSALNHCRSLLWSRRVVQEYLDFETELLAALRSLFLLDK